MCLSHDQVAALPEVEDLEWFGVLDQYNEVYDKVNTRHEKPLRQYNNILPYFVNTMDVSRTITHHPVTNTGCLLIPSSHRNPASDLCQTLLPVRSISPPTPFFSLSLQDPNIERYAADMNAGQVFATDAVLAHLMTCSRSVRPTHQSITFLRHGMVKYYL